MHVVPPDPCFSTLPALLILSIHYATFPCHPAAFKSGLVPVFLKLLLFTSPLTYTNTPNTKQRSVPVDPESSP